MLKNKIFLLSFIPLLMMTLVGCNSNNNNSEQVIAEKGTLENPYTIKEAIELIGTNSSLSSEEIYVKGVVSGTPKYKSNYKSYDAYLKDASGGKSLLVYSGTIDKNAGQNNLLEGDIVIASGHYMLYNSTPELAGSSDYGYPIYHSISRVSEDYENYEDDDKTLKTEIIFDEDNQATLAAYEGKNYVWKNDIFRFENDPGSQYSFAPENYVNPYRFYVGTYLHLRMIKGKFKYLLFETQQYYNFRGDEAITSGRVIVGTNKSYVVSKKGANYIKIHNSVYGATQDVAVKQIRIYKVTVAYYA